MAAGYDIGVSSSNAQSFSTPQNTAAGTVFNFSSPGASGDWYDQNATGNPVATAVATTKSPGSTTDVGTDTGGGNTSAPASASPINLTVVIVAITLLAAVWIFKKH